MSADDRAMRRVESASEQRRRRWADELTAGKPGGSRWLLKWVLALALALLLVLSLVAVLSPDPLLADSTCGPGCGSPRPWS